MTAIICTNCHRPYPENEVPYRCPHCCGVYDFEAQPAFDQEKANTALPGIWRYRDAFGLPEKAPSISLGEGNTPLVWDEVQGHEVAFKLEYLNPTGSFKDRGTAVMVSFLISRGVQSMVEDSSGNAGASLAAYAARSGLKARIFVPDYASGPKREQIGIYGAELTRILGPRSNAAEAVRRAAQGGAVYASHAYLPFGLTGLATLAYEMVEALGSAPGSVIVPAGQGSLLLGIGRGFTVLRQAGLISRIPTLVGVQARACAPLWALFVSGPAGLTWVSEGETLAEGIRIRHPVHGDAVYQMVEKNSGFFVAVDEEEILPGLEALAQRGFYVEPTSAVVWSGLAQVIGKVPDPIVVVLTGSGFKSTQ
jgi:threonine synthase